MYAVQKNVPLPQSSKKYPIDQMKVGDSFVVPCDSACIAKVRNLVCSNLQYWKQKKGKKGIKFATRQTENKLGIRVWRTA